MGRSPRTPIPDFDNGLVLNVSDAARRLLESCEPDTHQFLPVAYFDRQGELIEKRHFLIVCNRIDSLDRDHTTMVLFRGMVWQLARELDPSELPPGFDESRPPEMVFSSAQIGNVHLWHDKHSRAGPFLTDELVEAIEAAGPTGPRLSESRVRAV